MAAISGDLTERRGEERSPLARPSRRPGGGGKKLTSEPVEKKGKSKKEKRKKEKTKGKGGKRE